jgi:hypothetical protein
MHVRDDMMRPLTETHPRSAPFIAALLAIVIYLAVSWPLSEKLPSTLAQAIVVAVAVFLVIRHLSRKHTSREVGS